MIFPFYEYLKKTDAYFLRDKGLTCNLNQNEKNLFFEQVASLLKKFHNKRTFAIFLHVSKVMLHVGIIILLSTY